LRIKECMCSMILFDRNPNQQRLLLDREGGVLRHFKALLRSIYEQMFQSTYSKARALLIPS
jgi:hypothetical protein